MRGVKNLENGDGFFQVYNFVHNFFRKSRVLAMLGKFRLKPGWDRLAKLFYK